MSKGDSYRPVNKQLFDQNYERIFNKENNAPTSQQTDDGYCNCTGLGCIKTQSPPATEAPSGGTMPEPGTDEDFLNRFPIF